MLFSPDAHEPLVEEPWNAEAARAAIARIAADTESAFDGGWGAHPLDEETPLRFRGLYLGGAGVVDGLDRLRRRGHAEVRRDYVPYLEWLLGEPSDFPEDDDERSLWIGELGIRLVLQRLAPSGATSRGSPTWSRRTRRIRVAS